MSSSDSSFSIAESDVSIHQPCVQVLEASIRTFFFLLFCCRSSLLGGSWSAASSRSSSSRTSTRADIQEQVLDILAFERFREELAPDRLDIDDFGGGDQGLEFVCLIHSQNS